MCAMKPALALIMLCVCAVIVAQEPPDQPSRQKAPPAVCDAAMASLRQHDAKEVVLVLTLDDKGRVDSFQTESPEGLNLEKSGKAKAEIKKMRFQPALKDGRPAWAQILISLDCSESMAASSRP